jgi:hypothetical protein
MQMDLDGAGCLNNVPEKTGSGRLLLVLVKTEPLFCLPVDIGPAMRAFLLGQFAITLRGESRAPVEHCGESGSGWQKPS